MAERIFQQYFAPGIFYETIDGIARPCEVKDIVKLLTAATNNQSVVPLVTGKKIVVISGTLVSANAAGAVDFKSASGGTLKHRYLVPAAATAEPNAYIEQVPWGAFRTETGQALYADNLGADIIVASLCYIEMTPV